MKTEPVLQRDSEGFIRLAQPIKVSQSQAEAIIEAVYVNAGINLQIKQLDLTFAEYDTSKGMRGQKGLMRKWSDEERLYVLLHHEDGDAAVGDALGRLDKSLQKLLSRFMAWQYSEEGLLHRNESRECQAKAFLGIEEVAK